MNLSKIQNEIVKTIYGPILVLAGAGSGKTRVIIYRIIHMINNLNINPNNILALTFTKKSAKEMKNRLFILNQYNNSIASKITVGTFHSIFSKILRKESHFIGYDSNYTIYDNKESGSIIKKIIKNLNFENITDYKKIQEEISIYKNNLSFLKKNYKKTELFYKIYKKYIHKCFNMKVLDFDDILLHTNYLFFKFPNILKKYQNKFKYILIDEYQDTNFSQHTIIKNLSRKYNNIFAVGDDAQSIYSFRGAKISNILNFHNEYNKAKIFHLEKNYRSTKYIVQASNEIISFNKNQFIKKVWTENEHGEKIKIYHLSSDIDEAQRIITSILHIKQTNKLRYKDFAILYRINAQSPIIESILIKYKIPYKIYGSISMEKRVEIRDLLAYLKCINNLSDEESLLRILKKNITYKKTIDSIIDISRNENIRIYDVIKNIKIHKLNHKLKINKKTESYIQHTYNEINNIHTNINKYTNIYSITIHVIKTFLSNKKKEKFRSILYNIKQYIKDNKNSTNQHKNLSEFLQYFYINENIKNEEKSQEQDKVSMMTIHLAKGLEFSVVFITGLEENIFPTRNSNNFDRNLKIEIEEERRLFYVALTRAQKIVIITYSDNRFLWGKKMKNPPSRFIHELNKEFIEKQTYNINNRFSNELNNKFSNELNNKFSNELNNKFSNELNNKNNIVYYKGLKVFHKNFGIGKILYADYKIAKIKFEKSGEKKILLSLNKLMICK